MKKILTFLLLFFAINMECQNILFVGNKKYKTTQGWWFDTEASMDNSPKISVGKDKNNGLLIITAFTGGLKIGGTLIVYLEDDTIIVCKDRGIRDITNGECTTVYYLTIKEIERMKYSKIMSIRYNVSSGQFHKESYIARNVYKNYSDIEYTNNTEKPPHWNTHLDIRNLYE
jgi:hypothetical protein